MPNVIGDPDELTTAIRHVSSSEIHDIETQAKQNAAHIADQAKSRADKVRGEILSDARKRAREIRLHRRMKRTIEEKSQYLKARESLLNTVWDQARVKLQQLTQSEDEYTRILKHLAIAAISAIGNGTRVLSSDQKGHRLLTGEHLAAWADEASGLSGGDVVFKRADKPEETDGGLIVTDIDGRRRIDLTFAGRLESAREEIRNRVFQQLVDHE